MSPGTNVKPPVECFLFFGILFQEIMLTRAMDLGVTVVNMSHDFISFFSNTRVDLESGHTDEQPNPKQYREHKVGAELAS